MTRLILEFYTIKSEFWRSTTCDSFCNQLQFPRIVDIVDAFFCAITEFEFLEYIDTEIQSLCNLKGCIFVRILCGCVLICKQLKHTKSWVSFLFSFFIYCRERMFLISFERVRFLFGPGVTVSISIVLLVELKSDLRKVGTTK